MNSRSLIFVVCWLAAEFPAALAQVAGGSGVVAKAGDRFVSEREFLERFELLPSLYRHRKSGLERAKLELVYSLIAEKLLAQEALQRNLDQDSVFIARYDDVRKLLARDQLYRDEVANKVTLSSKETDQGVADAQQELLLSFLYFPRKEDAEFVRQQIKKVADFETMTLDTSLGATRDTATVIWGGAEPSVERAAYALKKGEVSGVVTAGEGYYIFTVSSIKRSSFFTSLQPAVLRERVTAKLRERKEEMRLNAFTKEFFRKGTGYARSEPFLKLAQALMAAFATDTTGTRLFLMEGKAQHLRRECSPWLADTLLVAGLTSWSVNDVIDRLFLGNFSILREEVKKIPRLLNRQLQIWVQQELLAQEALRRKLDERPDVQRRLQVWYESSLAGAMKEYIRRRTKASESELWSYLQSEDTLAAIPKVQIRELQTASLELMGEALSELEKGIAFEQVVERWTSDGELKRRRGLSDPFRITDRYPIGELAWQMTAGERYGPLKVPSGYLYFELVSKEVAPAGTDTSRSARIARARDELQRMKVKRTTDLFLAQVGQRRGFDLFEDRLRSLNVSPIPMMAFRILGFGGRMPAVPFVDRQIDWLNVEPPNETIFP